eukprot:523592-Lingulodinium_polyedra.AAC.1
MPRRVKIQKKDLFNYGFSSNCEGCKAVLRGGAARAHSEECRKRIEKAMEKEPKAREADRRINEFLKK